MPKIDTSKVIYSEVQIHNSDGALWAQGTVIYGIIEREQG